MRYILALEEPYESKTSSLELERDLYGFEDLPIARLFAEYGKVFFCFLYKLLCTYCDIF